MPNAEYGLVIRFDDQSGSFTHGFEAGGIYADMKRGELLLTGPVHSANRDLILRMAGKEGYDCEMKATDYDEWLEMRAQKLHTADGMATN